MLHQDAARTIRSGEKFVTHLPKTFNQVVKSSTVRHANRNELTPLVNSENNVGVKLNDDEPHKPVFSIPNASFDLKKEIEQQSKRIEEMKIMNATSMGWQNSEYQEEIGEQEVEEEEDEEQE